MTQQISTAATLSGITLYELMAPSTSSTNSSGQTQSPDPTLLGTSGYQAYDLSCTGSSGCTLNFRVGETPVVIMATEN